MNQAELAVRSTVAKGDKSGYVSKDVVGAKSLISRKRKNIILGSKSKRLRIEKEDLIELKITWEEAQGLLRPPPKHVPTVVVIEGFEFEEYEVHMKVLLLFFLEGLHCHVLFIVFLTQIFLLPWQGRRTLLLLYSISVILFLLSSLLQYVDIDDVG